MTTARRGLVLAGGGMRVAWQAGVIAALDEAGLIFEHIDGTSGGIFNAGALLSGVSPVELVERWCKLDVQKFVSYLGPLDYLKGPTNLPAMGDADGIVGSVLPGLGVSIDAIRACQAMSGTFNVANFTRKRCVAIPHTDIDLQRLVAGVSLPIFMPAVKHGGETWTDAVWMRDANPLEVARRGCNEIWIAWCIGNTARWGEGPLEQYVHMIELSANGSLIEDLERLGEFPSPPTVHLIKPSFPLPLDPDYFLGRISTETLIAQGYRDACRYLQSDRRNTGTLIAETATSMHDRPAGLRVHAGYKLAMHHDGSVLDTPPLEGSMLQIDIEVDDLDAFVTDPAAGVALVGSIVHDGAPRTLLRGGVFNMIRTEDGSHFTGRAECGRPANPLTLHIEGVWHDDPGLDLWDDLTRIDVRLCDAGNVTVSNGRGSLGLAGLRRLVTSAEPTGVHDLGDRARVIGRGLAFLFGTLGDRARTPDLTER